MKRINHRSGWILAICFMFCFYPLFAQQDSVNYVTVSGIIKDKQSKKDLNYVNISLLGSNIGTVTNEDGAFTLKFPESYSTPVIGISHLGYKSEKIQVDKNNLEDMKILLTPQANLINEIVVIGLNPLSIVQEAIKRIPRNYSGKPNMLTGFYRETVQKGRKYISVSEAVTDMYKTPYSESINSDKVQIIKGRRLLSQKPSDTLSVKLIGGPNLSLVMDIVKNRESLINPDELYFYDFRMAESVNIDNKPQYVVSFIPKVIMPEALFYGNMYIDKENFTFTRIEFSLSMDSQEKAIRAILHKKPLGLRFRPQELSFLITYKVDDGVAYLNYIRNNIRFKCDWKKRLFATNYTVVSEMVVTDRNSNNIKPISNKYSFDIRDAFYDKVANFDNENFWGNYNIIEPSESLDHAVYKLKKQSK